MTTLAMTPTTPMDLLRSHEMLTDNSCVGWALEFILKLEGKIKPDEYPLQRKFPDGCGFGETERKYLADRGLVPDQSWLDLAAFEKRAEAEIAESRTVALMVPSWFGINPATGRLRVELHAWVAIPTHPGHEYRSRKCGRLEPLGPLALAQEYSQIRRDLMPDWEIHTLWYKRASDAEPSP